MSDSEGKGRKPVLPMGRLLYDEHVPAILKAAGVTLDELVRRHRAGDWGMVDDNEREYQDWRAANGQAVTSEFLIWPDGKARTVFITTEERIMHVVVVPKSPVE